MNDSVATRSNPTAVILAGGRGTRLAGLYPNLPKPLIPACGRPFLGWITIWLASQGVKDFAYSTGYRGEQIEEWIKSFKINKTFRFSCRRERQPLGTGGGLINCLDLCGETVFALNGDSLLLVDLHQLFDLLVDDVDGVLVGLTVPDTSRFGTLEISADGLLQKFAEKRPGRGEINGGIYLLRRRLLEDFPKQTAVSLEDEILPALLESGARLKVYRAANVPFLDIGTPESVIQAEDFITKNHRYFVVPTD